MKTITVCGYSDDLVSIGGDIRHEIDALDVESTKLSFSEGTVLTVVYDADGCWRVNRIEEGTAKMEKVEADGADTDNYSDRVTITGDIKWIRSGKWIARVNG